MNLLNLQSASVILFMVLCMKYFKCLHKFLQLDSVDFLWLLVKAYVMHLL
jgi:hypothetical protein